MLTTEFAHQDWKRVLFYIPVVTPWWFAQVIFPLIQAMSKAQEVHVMVPPYWQGTGIGAGQAALVSQTDGVFWHLLDGPSHPDLRVDASQDAELLDFVHRLAPDLTLCRSADIKTTQRFPGVVKHMMEGAAPPFKSGQNRIRLEDNLFDYGLMPSFTCAEASQLDALGELLWADQITSLIQSLPSRTQFCTENGLPLNRKIIALPLEYEHPENFFSQHLPYPDNAAMIGAIAAQIPDDLVLAVTQHPLNELHSEIGSVHAAVAAQDERVVLLDSAEIQGRKTLTLAFHCDGMITCTSKSWAACAAFGNPLARLTAFQTGDWVNAYSEVEQFLFDVRAGTARRPDIDLARRWFAYHFANCAFVPCATSITAQIISEYAHNPHNPAMWESSIAAYREQFVTDEGR